MPDTLTRLSRHIRLSKVASGTIPDQTPPFLILFINSICNLKCEHCFYWESLNQRDDLTFAEIEALSRDLGTVDNLNLSGGEPFLRKEFAEIVTMFVRNNGTRQVYVPTNGWYTKKTVEAVKTILQDKDLWYFVCELSLDGTFVFPDHSASAKGSFDHAWRPTRCTAGDRPAPAHPFDLNRHRREPDEIRRLTDPCTDAAPRWIITTSPSSGHRKIRRCRAGVAGVLRSHEHCGRAGRRGNMAGSDQRRSDAKWEK
jgi:hypothetical protein